MVSRIGIIGAGEMGAAVAGRLAEAGAEILTSLAGRSDASRERAAAAGMRDVGGAGLAEADIILSIIPPDRALPAAEAVCAALTPAERRPLYVDCNAIAPESAASIERVVSEAHMQFVDGGIVGGPPRPGQPGPMIYLSGADAAAVAGTLNPLGIRARDLGLPNGAASALKLSYAGINKGLIAIAATMAIAAARHGVGDALAAELRESLPHLADSFSRGVPGMLSKAWRWGPEMEEIRDFIGTNAQSGAAYEAFARFYDQVAGDTDLQTMLRVFYDAPESDKRS